MVEKEVIEKDLTKDVKYIVDALRQRKSALKSASDASINPLDRLMLMSKIEELDIAISYIEATLNKK